MKNHLYKEGKWIAERLENRKEERAKKAQEPDDSEDQSEEPNQQEPIHKMTRKQGKRDAPEEDTFYEDTTPDFNPKRLKVGKQDRKDKLPA